MISRPRLLAVFSVARELGKTAGEILSSMSSLELAMWVAFLHLKPEDMEKKKTVDEQLLSLFGKPNANR